MGRALACKRDEGGRSGRGVRGRGREERERGEGMMRVRVGLLRKGAGEGLAQYFTDGVLV